MRTLDRVATTRVAHQKEHLVVRVHGHDDGLVARIGAGERKLVDVAAGSRACVRVRRRLGEGAGSTMTCQIKGKHKPVTVIVSLSPK